MAQVSKNKDLHKAKDAKKDEFYTQLSDIERELRYYEGHFKDKVVYCNCDDPYESNFFKYFALKFNFLGLKKLIATCYIGSPIANTQLSLFDDESEENKTTKMPHKIVITETPDMNNDGAVDLTDVELLLGSNKNYLTRLKGDGDFRSKECLELLKEADIVVTNPPFSLFREYVEQLIEYDKKFVIIGNVNAITYKDIFKLIKENKLWTGYSIRSGDREFAVPDNYPLNAASCRIDENGKKYIRVKGVRWFTNLDYKERYEDIILYKQYNSEEYPKFENYDAINVNTTKDIPIDYKGFMGVPITFLDKYNPNQFEIIGLGISNSGIEIGVQPYKEEHKKYRKEVQKRGAVDGDLYMMTNGVVDVPYARILIKNKTV